MYSLMLMAAVAAGPDATAFGERLFCRPLCCRPLLCRPLFCRPLFRGCLLARMRCRLGCGESAPCDAGPPACPTGGCPNDGYAAGGPFPGPGPALPGGEWHGGGFPGYPVDGQPFAVGGVPPLPSGFTAPPGWVLVPAQAGVPGNSFAAGTPNGGFAPVNPADTYAPPAAKPAAGPDLPYPREMAPQFPTGSPSARSTFPSLSLPSARPSPNQSAFGTPTDKAMPKPLFGRSKPVTPAAAELDAGNPASGPARMTFHVPASATITVDGYPVAGDGPVRKFHTPELAAGERYFYEFKAEMSVDGRTVTESKRVELRAGDDLSESFPKLTTAAQPTP